MSGILSHFFFSSRRRHTRSKRDWSSDVCSSDLGAARTSRSFRCQRAWHACAPSLRPGRDDLRGIVKTERRPREAAPNALPGEERSLEASLRPQRLSDDEYINQDTVKEQLRIVIAAAKARGDPLEHIALYGPPGVGKTSLAYVIARELGVPIHVTSGPAIERAADLAAILTNLSDGAVLFVDEMHRLPRVVEEVLYPAMEEFHLDIVLGKGPGARTLRLPLPKFTLVGATTRYGRLSAPLRDRFGATYRLDLFETDALDRVVQRAARILKVEIEPAA